MNDNTSERLEMRWVPVLDPSGRARMQARWVGGVAESAAHTAHTAHAAHAA